MSDRKWSKKKIEPFNPVKPSVDPIRPGKDENFRHGPDTPDVHMFDHFAKESTDRYGTEIDFFSQDLDPKYRDPLYGEPTQRVWTGPYRLYAWVSWADSTPIVDDSGFRFRWQAQCWIPRASLEAIKAPYPFEGDVIRFWNVPFFNETAASGQDIKSAGYFFDVVNADDDGHFLDEAHFVGFKIDLVRRGEFGAEQRIIDPC